MAQATIVMRLDAAAGRRLYDEMGRGNFAFRPLAYARWSARGEEASVSLYESGKLVVQGKGAQAFVDRYLPGVKSAPGKAAPAPTLAPGAAEIGSDESGKGDYFGPLVVAATLVTPEDLPWLTELGVQDSKAATDGLVKRVEGVLLDRLPSAVRVLEPEVYNEAWAEERNLNRLLGTLHAEVLDAVVTEAGEAHAQARIVVDRFGDPEHVRRHLSPAAKAHPFIMPTKGERHPAVAAASFLARAAFLRGMDEASNLAGGTLYRGASDPRILDVGRRLLAEGGREWLGRFAKLHFKVTLKL